MPLRWCDPLTAARKVGAGSNLGTQRARIQTLALAPPYHSQGPSILLPTRTHTGQVSGCKSSESEGGSRSALQIGRSKNMRVD